MAAVTDGSILVLLRTIRRDCDSIAASCDKRMEKEKNLERSELLFDIKNDMLEVAKLFDSITQMQLEKQESKSIFDAGLTKLHQQLAKLS